MRSSIPQKQPPARIVVSSVVSHPGLPPAGGRTHVLGSVVAADCVAAAPPGLLSLLPPLNSPAYAP